MKFISILFAVMFVGLFACLLFAASYAIVSGTFFVVRLFKPQFAELRVIETDNAKADRKEIRKVALDFVLATKRQQENDRKKKLEELLNSVGKPANELSWTLESLKTEVQARPRSTEPEPEDLWQICRLDQGRRRYLAVWRSTREGGLRTGWHPSQKYGIRTSAEAANRWCAMLEGTSITPCNAASRQIIRTESAKLRSEHATT